MVTTLTAQQRQSAIDQLTTTEQSLLALTTSLTPAQWQFQESPTRWSIAEILEHCIVFERFITTRILEALTTPPTPEKKPQAPAKDSLVQSLGHPDSRQTKLQSREAALPTNRWSNPTDLQAELHQTRAQTIQFATQTQSPLQDHFFPHIAFGDLDCYQWLLVIAQHTQRHANQIEEIKSNLNYPIL